MGNARIIVTASLFSLAALALWVVPSADPVGARWVSLAPGSIALAGWVLLVFRRAKLRRVEREIGGIEIPLRASFTGVRNLPLVSLGSNSIAPYLRLGATHMVHGMFLSRSPYVWIERVEAMTLPATRLLVFVWTWAPQTCVVNVAGEAARIAALRWLDERGVPLAESARRVLAAASSTGAVDAPMRAR